MKRDLVLRVLVILVPMAVLGCEKPQAIRHYKVDKPVVVDAENRGTAKHNPLIKDPTRDSAKDRMLGAMIVEGEDIWFFKTVGKTKEMEKVVGQVLDLVRSVTFQNDKPSWKKPESWEEKRESSDSIRYATLTVKKAQTGDDQIEVTVTRLSLPLAVDLDSVLLSNLNRWRGQMKLPKVLRNRLFRPKAKKGEEAQARKEGVLLTEWTGQRRIYHADLSGSFTPRMRPGSPHGGASLPRAAPPIAAPASDEFTHVAPKTWQPGRMNSFRKLAFQVGSGPQKAEITVSVAGGDLLSNVNRWRGQVQLPPISATQLASASTKVPVGQKLTGDYFELKGEPTTIMAVILTRGPQKWFFKVTGATKTAMSEKDNFLEFLKSFEFK